MKLQLHLSAYERLNRKFKNKLSIRDPSFQDNNIDPVKQAFSYINTPTHIQHQDPRASRTVAIMPFLGVNMGAGHSVLENRYEYLKLCIWSVSKIFPNVVVGVLSADDRDWIL